MSEWLKQNNLVTNVILFA